MGGAGFSSDEVYTRVFTGDDAEAVGQFPYQQFNNVASLLQKPVSF